MKRFPSRRRALVGALLVAGLLWAADWLAGPTRPAPAKAGQTGTGAPATAPASWQDINDLVARFTRTDYDSVAGELAQLERDLFQPGPSILAALAVAADPALPDEPAHPVEAPGRTPDFKEGHKLMGVVVGTHALAVIDDHVLPLNGELDGYTLVDVQRDYVILQERGTENHVTLKLEPRPKNP